jgi:hypothetical protein
MHIIHADSVQTLASLVMGFRTSAHCEEGFTGTLQITTSSAINIASACLLAV